MTKNKKIISLISLIFIVLVGISVYLVVYAFDYRSVLSPFSPGTRISNIYIGGKTAYQVEEELDTLITEWKTCDKLAIELNYQNHAYTIDIDPDIFSFNVEKSVKNIKNNEKTNYDKGTNILLVDFKEENQIATILAKHYTNLKFTDFDIEIIEKELIKKVSLLQKEIYIDLAIALNEESAKNNKVGEVKTIVLEGDRSNKLTELINRYFSEPIEIKAREQFSFNELIINLYEEYDNSLKLNFNELAKIFDYYFTNDELNRMATGVYNTILPTNFINIGKKTSNVLPYYTTSGFESCVRINFDYVVTDNQVTAINFKNIDDLTFYNPNNHAYYLEINIETDELTFQLYGPEFIYDFEINPNTEVIIDDDTGQIGYYSVVERIIKLNNKTLDKIVLAEDTY